MPIEYNTPKRLGNSKYYDQCTADTDTNDLYISVLTKNADDSFSLAEPSEESDRIYETIVSTMIKAKEKKKATTAEIGEAKCYWCNARGCDTKTAEGVEIHASCA